MSYVAIWLRACLHWRCAYFQTLSWNDSIFVVDWDILYKLCRSANKWSNGFVFSGKIWWQFFSCDKAYSKYHTRRPTTPKYTLPQRLVYQALPHVEPHGDALLRRENDLINSLRRNSANTLELQVNQGSRKTLLTLSARFFIVLIVSFIRKMTERKRALLEFEEEQIFVI